MSMSVFGEKTVIPSEEMLAGALADSMVMWEETRAHVAAICGDESGEWKFYSKKAGWSLVVKSGKRTILYLIPQDGYFKINFVFGEKAAAASMSYDLPKEVTNLIEKATPYTEGRSFMFDVKTQTDADAAKTLIKIKNAN